MVYTDQLGRTIELNAIPNRIVSVVPSQTEFLYDLGVHVVGITKFCIHPKVWFEEKPKVGGTKNLNLEKIRSLQPDLIIANKEENTQADIEALAAEFPVYISDINTLPDALEMMEVLAVMLDRKEAGAILRERLEQAFAHLKAALGNRIKPTERVAYVIWKDPWMVAGSQTFIDAMLQAGGFENAFADLERYPVVSLDELEARNCDRVFLSSEPYPFKETHVEGLQERFGKNTVQLVDGELFSWYGTRLVHTPAYLESLL
jgi:ABC-type Fe3+-hydroxamate transport system substrate-binding protein